MGEWLFDTPSIFKDSMTTAVNSTDSIESKEDTMTKTAANTTVNAETIANEKENTVSTATKTAKTAAKTTRKRLSRDEWKVKYIAGLQAKADQFDAMDTDMPVATSLYHALNTERTGCNLKPLHASELEKKMLALASIENGWPTSEFISRNQAEEYGGAPKDGAKGIKIHGPNVGRGYTVYNAVDIEWADGEPVWQDDVADAHSEKYAQYKLLDKARKANKRLRQAEKDAKAANEAAGIENKGKGKGKAKKAKAAAPAPAPTNEYADMAEMMKLVMQQNAQLMAMLMANQQ